jgi:uncharacterized membrane protein
MTRRGPLQFWRVHFLGVELVAGLLVGGATVALAEWGETNFLCGALTDNRAPVYGAIATIAGSLLGFVITSVSILLGYVNTHLGPLRNTAHYPTLWNTYKSGIKMLALTTLMAIVALIWDRDKSPQRFVMYGVLVASILSLLRLVRCIWILEQVIAVVTRRRPDEDASEPGPPASDTSS